MEPLGFLIAVTDPSGLILLVSAILGGGGLAAIVAYRKASPEIESMSVNTLRGVIEELRDELTRKDKLAAEQNRVIGEQRQQIKECLEQVALAHERITQLETEPPSHLA